MQIKKIFLWGCLVAGFAYVVGMVHAATSEVKSSVTIINPASIASAVATQVLLGTSTGYLSIQIPGSAEAVRAAGSNEPQRISLCFGTTVETQDNLLSCIYPKQISDAENKPIDSPPALEKIQFLSVNDGTLNGTHGVSLLIFEDSNQRLIAIVEFN